MDAEALDKIRKSAAAAVRQSFEEMAFIDTGESAEQEPVECGQVLYIDIIDPFQGALLLYLPYRCKKMIIENIYAEDFETIDPKKIDDCLLEILNVLAGNFLNIHFGRGINYRVDIPKILFDDAEAGIKRPPYIEIYFDAEGEHFKLGIIIESMQNAL